MSKPRLFLLSVLASTLALAACEQKSTSAAQPVAPIVSPDFAEACAPEDATAVYPGEHWTPVNPADAGWDDDGVERFLNAAEYAHGVGDRLTVIGDRRISSSRELTARR